MPEQTVQLSLPLDDAWDAGDRVQAYTDFGTGTLDLSRPLLSRAAEVYPGQSAAMVYGEQPYATGRHGDHQAALDGAMGDTIYGDTPHGEAPPLLRISVEAPPAFGMWRFAAQVTHRTGNVQGGAPAAVTAMISATDPTPLARFAFLAYDAGTDVATFEFAMGVE